MGSSYRPKARSSPALRLAVLLGLFAGVQYLGFGPAFSVRGNWEGGLEDVLHLPKGLENHVVGGLTFDKNGASINVEDGHMNLRYADGPMSFSMDDGSAWEANLTEDGMMLRARGKGANDISWDASKRSNVRGLGDVDINVNSERDFGVAVAPPLPDIAGAKLKVLARTQGEDIYARLDAHRQLGKDMDLSYSVENVDGDYDLANLAHAAQFVGKHGQGSLVAKVASQGQATSYNATYAHDLSQALRGDSGVVVGVDNEGLYGTFAKSHEVATGVKAGYAFRGRSALSEGADMNFDHSAKLSSDLGTLKLSQANGDPVEANFASNIAMGGNSVRGELGYAVGAEEPTFNLTLTSDLADALKRLDGDGSLQVGIDDASPDGIYGRLAASRKFGKDVNVRYASAGRLNDLEHSLTLSNGLGFGQLVKQGDADPRLRLGYQFNV